jgi:phage baseplate assembly protein W
MRDVAGRRVATGSPLGFPWGIDGRGRTVAVDHPGHLRDLIEQVLLTAPGERVMRPDFGCGLLGMVFEPGGPQVAATLQLVVQGALERELGDVLALREVTVEAVDAALEVTVTYDELRTGTSQVVTVRTAATGGAT